MNIELFCFFFHVGFLYFYFIMCVNFAFAMSAPDPPICSIADRLVALYISVVAEFLIKGIVSRYKGYI